MMGKIVVKLITKEEDLQAAYSLRRDVFVVEQKVSVEDEFDKFEEESCHFLAMIDDEPAGTARWRKTDHGIKLERFAVSMNYRKKGVGKALVCAVLNHIDQSEVVGKIYLHAQLEAIPLYASFGFQIVGTQFTECAIEHRLMELTISSGIKP